MTRRHRLRRVFLAFVALAAVACGVLGVLAGLGVWRPHTGLLAAPVAAQQPVVPADADDESLDPHDLAPQRQRVRMIPDQFDPVSSPKKMIGTPWANITVWPD